MASTSKNYTQNDGAVGGSLETYEIPCHICNLTEVDDIMYGPFMAQGGIRCHYFCLLFCFELESKGCDVKDMAGFRVDDIKEAVLKLKKKDTKCYYCNGPQAASVCCKKICRKVFHVPCAMKNNALMRFFGSFETYCDDHAWKVIKRTERPDEKQLCMICYELLGEYNPVSCFIPPCCIETVKEKEPGKTYWLHYRCVMQGTRQLGYYFNCFPFSCAKTDDEAKQGYLDCGIFIPHRDALYEGGKYYKHLDKKRKVQHFDTTYDQDATLLQNPLKVQEEVVCNYDTRCVGRDLGMNDLIYCKMDDCNAFVHIKCIRYFRDLKSNEEARKENFFCIQCVKNSCLGLI